jgi:hypothetical protein
MQVWVNKVAWGMVPVLKELVDQKSIGLKKSYGRGLGVARKMFIKGDKISAVWRNKFKRSIIHHGDHN